MVRAVEGGSSIRAAARRFAVSPSAAIKLMQRMRATGRAALLFLPPYSPDLNPIEQLFAKLKALLRHVAARTRDELREAIGRLLATVPASECANYLRHCGYGSI
jgi:transposase